jgi:hypothetical protein
MKYGRILRIFQASAKSRQSIEASDESATHPKAMTIMHSEEEIFESGPVSQN